MERADGQALIEAPTRPGLRCPLASAAMRGLGDLNVWWRLGLAVLGPVARALFRIRVVGAGHVPSEGAAIVASNHVSALDGPILAIVIARERRRMTRFVTGAEFFERPAYGWILRLFRQIPIRRGTGDDRALDEAVGTVRSGAVAGIFPEGRVNANPDDGLQRGRTGVGRIARAADVPVVPVAIWGTQHRWPRHGLRWNRPWQTTVAIAFGPPITVDASHDAAELTARVMDAIDESLARARHLRGGG
jgi:1-acyl-sn-glycerol-3-phosphate acyltransferase